jgi:hypothetical protein
LLLLEQGDVGAESASIETALASIPGHALGRARLLPARVEVKLAASDPTAALEAATELGMIAAAYPTIALRAAALGAQGAVAAARRERSGLAQRRERWRLWRETPAPFEAARIGVLLARARLAAGDRGGALLEIDAAAAAFERLGAAVSSAWRKDCVGRPDCPVGMNEGRPRRPTTAGDHDGAARRRGRGGSRLRRPERRRVSLYSVRVR